MDENDKINGLIEKASALSRQQQQMQKDLQELHHEIYKLRREEIPESVTNFKPVEQVPVEPVTASPTIITPLLDIQASAHESESTDSGRTTKVRTPKDDSAFEEFIGTNLLNKIGIIVLVLGIGYGVKYSIDHNLLSPLTRVILGYIASTVLIVFAMRLKARLATFSAVLLSGGMASIYFITYAAFDFYGLIPQTFAFALMVLFTAFTVFAAIRYDMQVIAIIGLVGAYGVPFLLSDGSGRVVILFSYVAMINAGILVIAFRKSWGALYYLAFFLTWTIFSLWWMSDYDADKFLWQSVTFSTLFFVIFYITLLAHKVMRDEPFDRLDAVLLLFNSFIYFAFGYQSIEQLIGGETYLGLFTVFNAVLHFVVCTLLYAKRRSHRDTFYFAAGLVIVFITLAIPVELDGRWVSLIWAIEAMVLFSIGRTKSFPIYETISYVLVGLAFVSLIQDMAAFYNYSLYEFEPHHAFLLNGQFLTSLITLVCFAGIYLLNNKEFRPPLPRESQAMLILTLSIGILALLTAYFMFYKEIESFWVQRRLASYLSVPAHDNMTQMDMYDDDIESFGKLWLINYSAGFCIIVSFVLLRSSQPRFFTIATIGANLVTIVVFLALGLGVLSVLRESYVQQTDANIYARGPGNIIIRYVCFLFLVPLVWLSSKLLRRVPKLDPSALEIEKIAVHFIAITLLSSELLHWLELWNVANSDRLALSILWGAYALALIVRGLWKADKTLRMFGIVVFGSTLVKLFAYDITDMSTIAKTIVMVILGTLLLVASFLYNRTTKIKS